MASRFLLPLLSFGALSALPTRAGSQEIITQLFKHATDLAPYAQVSTLNADDAIHGTMTGYGFEVLFSVGAIPQSSWEIELALGYGYLAGFKSTSQAVDLRGSVRALPEVSVYATYGRGGIEPYVGLHTGLLSIWHGRAYDTAGEQYGLEAETFQGGVTSGVGWNGFWAEGSYRVRDFPSIDWDLPGSAVALPAAFPRALNMSGWNLRAGYQFKIGTAGDDKTAEP